MVPLVLLVSPVFRRAPRLRMCTSPSDDLGFNRARQDAVPTDPATAASQMSFALTQALDGGKRALAVNIEVPELLPTSRGYDVDAHALIVIAAAQALCREADGTAEVLVHNLDCALRVQLLLRDSILEGRVSVACAAWLAKKDGLGAPKQPQPLLLVGPDGEAEAAAMSLARLQARQAGAPVVQLNHRPSAAGVLQRLPFFGKGSKQWA